MNDRNISNVGYNLTHKKDIKRKKHRWTYGMYIKLRTRDDKIETSVVIIKSYIRIIWNN